MKTLEELNREINYALRVTNQVAVDVAASSLRERRAALNEITEALVHLDALQRILVADDPSLEYHFDPDRKATPAMKRIAELVESADRLVESEQFSEAAAMLQSACDLQPPPLVYETIAKRLEDVRSKQERK